MKKTAYFGFAGVAALLALAEGAPTFAAAASASDQAAASAAPSGTALQEVIVTARRRAESIEKVPATITALSGQALVQQGIHTEGDLQLAVPGLMIRTGNTNQVLNYTIRGESLDQYSGSAPGVQAYVDEAPIASNTPSAFYDLGGVQVLKGPQGTLFGRNSTGGAVLFQTQQPTNNFGGYVSVQYGNLDKLITEGAINLPIIKDKVLLRLAASYQQGGAFVHNLYDGRTLGDTDGFSGRATLLLRPVDKLTNVTTVQFGHLYGTPTAYALRSVDACGAPNEGNASCTFEPTSFGWDSFINSLENAPNKSPRSPPYFVYAGGMSGLQAFIASQPRYTADEPGPWKAKTISAFVANTTTYEVSPSITLKNIFGYNRVNGGSQYSDATPYGLLSIGGSLNSMGTEAGIDQYSEINERVISDELQLQGKAFDDRLTYIVGFFYDDDENTLNSPINVNIYLGAPIGFINFPLRYHSIADTKSYAVFSQATYAITDKLNITGGVRGTWADLNQYQAPDSGNYHVPGYDQNPLHASQSNPSWTFSLDYHFTPEVMGYVTTRGSWRVGGYTVAGAPLGDTVLTTTCPPQFGGAVCGNYFLPETTKDVEVGVKFNGRVADIPLQLNVDGYYSWIDDIQKTAYTNVIVNGIPTETSNTYNVPESEIRGIEADFQARPAPWLRLGGSISYADAEFSAESIQQYKVSPFGDLPKYSGSVYVDFIAAVKDNAGTLDLHVDYYGQSSFWPTSLGNFNEPNAKIPGYGLVNMRLDWTDPLGAKGLTVSGFVKNLGDKLYFTGGSASEVVQETEVGNWGMPRTYGFVLRYDF
jgi:iron complex outermembrane receptor protein